MLGCRRDQLGKTQRKRELIFCLGDFFCAPFGNCFHLWWFDSFLLALAFSGFGLLAVVGFWLLLFVALFAQLPDVRRYWLCPCPYSSFLAPAVILALLHSFTREL